MTLTMPFTTVRDVLRYAVSRFQQAQLVFGHGCANAYDEAVYLILHTLHLPLDTLEPFLDARLLDTEIDAVLNIIERRTTERVPAAYLTNEAWMHGRRFYVDTRVIVPRSFIGEWLEESLHPYIDDADAISAVLELCTGSGCLAILAAQAFPNADIDAVDLCPRALEVAHINTRDYALEPRITFFEGNLFAPLAKRRYDIIIANPPYVNDASMHALPAEYRHEPPRALAGGVDGMDIVSRIIHEAREWLTDEGILVIEIGNERANVEAAFDALDLIWLPTSAGDDQVFLIHARDLPTSTVNPSIIH